MTEEYVKGETFKFGNVTVTNYRPVLTLPEKKKREKQIQDTMSRVMRDYIHRKDEQHGK